MSKIREMLINHEGNKTHLYKDSLGILTIGVGWNIQEKGLPSHIIDALLDYSIAEAQGYCVKYSWYLDLCQPRKDAIIDMMFNLGPSRFAGFKIFILLMANEDYKNASVEMLDSKWAKQVGGRAQYLSKLIKNGAY